MSTATPLDTDVPNPGRVVKMLIEAKGGDYIAAAAAVGCSRASLSDRLSGKTQFRAGELANLARHFGVRPSVFFIPPMQFFTEMASSSGYKPGFALSVVPGGVDDTSEHGEQGVLALDRNLAAL